MMVRSEALRPLLLIVRYTFIDQQTFKLIFTILNSIPPGLFTKNSPGIYIIQRLINRFHSSTHYQIFPAALFYYFTFHQQCETNYVSCFHSLYRLIVLISDILTQHNFTLRYLYKLHLPSFLLRTANFSFPYSLS